MGVRIFWFLLVGFIFYVVLTHKQGLTSDSSKYTGISALICQYFFFLFRFVISVLCMVMEGVKQLEHRFGDSVDLS